MSIFEAVNLSEGPFLILYIMFSKMNYDYISPRFRLFLRTLENFVLTHVNVFYGQKFYRYFEEVRYSFCHCYIFFVINVSNL